MWDFVAYAKESKKKVMDTLDSIKKDLWRDAKSSKRYTTGEFVGGVLVNTGKMIYIAGVAVLTATAYVLSLKFVDDMVIQPIKEWTKEAEEDDDWYTSSFHSSRGRNKATAKDLLEIAVPEDSPGEAGGTAGNGESEEAGAGEAVFEIGSYLYYTGENLYGTYGGNGYGGNANGHPYTVRYDYRIEVLIDTGDWIGRVNMERLYVEDKAGSEITESDLEYLREHTSAAATCAVHMDICDDGIYYYLTDFEWDNGEPFVWGFDKDGQCIVGTNGKKYYDGVGNGELPYYKDTVMLLQPYYLNQDYYYAFTHFIPTAIPDAEAWNSAAALLKPQEISIEVLSEMGDASAQENVTEGDSEEDGQDSGTGQDETGQEPEGAKDEPDPGEGSEDRTSEGDEEPEDDEAEFVEPGPPTVSTEGNGTAEAEPDGTVTLRPDEGNRVGSVSVNGQDTPVPQSGGQLTGLTPKDRVDAKFREGAPQDGNSAPGKESNDPNGKETDGDHEQGDDPAGDDLPEPEVTPEETPKKEPEDQRPLETGQPMAGLSCTRAQVIHYLWNRAGQPAATIENPFGDVLESDYYYEAVRWAAEIGIIPISGSEFQPHRICTYRERYWMIRLYFAQTGYTMQEEDG